MQTFEDSITQLNISRLAYLGHATIIINVAWPI